MESSGRQFMSKVGLQTLQELCIDVIVARLRVSVDAEVLSTNADAWDRALTVADSQAKNIEDRLPQELIRRIVKNLSELPSHAGLIVASMLSKSLDKITTKSLQDSDNVSSFPSPILRTLVSTFAPSLVKVALEGIYIEDDVLDALSCSPSARTLQKLSINTALITDASAHVWKRFQVLKSLNLSYCDLLGTETFEHIANHPSLEKLAFLGKTMPVSEILKIVLRPDSLPFLCSLNLFSELQGFDVSATTLRDLLRQRPNRERLENLGYIQQDEDLSVILEIHDLCPNLDSLVTTPTEAQTPVPEAWLGKVPNLNTLYASKFIIDRSEDILDLSRRFPNLRSVHFGAVHQRDNFVLRFPFHQLDAFCNVRYICIKTVIMTPLQLPQSLKILEYEHFGPETLPDDQVTSFCDSICSGIPNFRSLFIRLPGHSFRKKHIGTLVSRLPGLTRLALVNRSGRRPPDDEADEAPFQLVHPNLTSINLPIKFTYGWLGKYTVFAEHTLPVSCDHLKPTILPRANYFYVYLPDEEKVIDKIIHDAVEAINSFGPQINAIILDSFGIPISDYSLDLLSSLRGVAVLRLQQGHLSQKQAQKLVAAFPLLSQLSLRFVPESTDFPWIRFSRLRELMLTLSNDFEGSPPTTATHAPLSITKSQLPYLTKLEVEFEHPIFSGLILADFEHLHQLDVGSSERLALSICIQNCKLLARASIANIVISSLEMTGLPGLAQLHFMSPRLTSDVSLNVAGCSGMRSCRTGSQFSHGTEREKWLQLEAQIKTSSPQVAFS